MFNAHFNAKSARDGKLQRKCCGKARWDGLQNQPRLPVRHHSQAIKSLPIVFVGLALISSSSCSTTPKPNYQKAVESNLVETDISLKVLTNFDAGQIDRARNIAMVPVFLDLDDVRYYTIEGMVSLTPEEKQEWTKVARETLEYMIRHQDDWDSRQLAVQAGMRGLHFLLTEPEDARRLNELSEHLTQVEQKRSEKQKP